MQYLPNSSHINLSILAESGQAFRIRHLSENRYAVPSANTVFVVEQRRDGLYYETFSKNTPQCIERVFRTNIDTQELQKEMKSDPFIEKACTTHGIVPLMQQEYFEVIISFIISANKHFRHICQCVEAICNQYGDSLETPYGVFHLFPSPAQLANASVLDLKACKVGYRAEYILSTAKRIAEDTEFLKRIEHLSDDTAITELKTLLGVGDKVADCILLFGYARDLAVPYDVWLQRIMHDLYDFPQGTPYKVYRAFNERHFGKYAGWVQQTLFYHARKVHSRGVSLKETWFKDNE